MFIKWICSTFIIGLLPLSIRIIIYIFLKNKSGFVLWDPLDFFILVLVINGSIITESPKNDFCFSKNFSIAGICISTVFIALIYLNSVMKDFFNQDSILLAATFLAATFSLQGFVIMYQISKIKEGDIK